MTVLENVEVGLHCRTKSGPVRALLKTGFEKREEKNITAKAMEILDFLGLARYGNDYASNLPYGDQAPLGDRPGPGLRAEASAPGRTGGRHEPRPRRPT